MANKIAIYGGSFDPPHLGHLEIIKKALQTLEIDTLFVVPNFLNPFKTDVKASGPLRLKWLKEICKDIKGVEVSDFEIQRAAPTPSIVTIKHFRQKYDKIYFIIGADNVEKLHLWKDYETLDSLVEWVVATRSGYSVQKYKTLQVDVDISSTALRQNLDKRYIPKEIFNQVKEIYEQH